MGEVEEERGGQFVLHCDVDSFFVQVEQQRHPELQGKPVAIQQHQDIIAANAAAKAAGVTKHCAPAEARRLLRPLGGVVHHVHLEPGGRVSYRPYREASARLIRLLKGLPWACVVEKASIDEAFVLLQPGPGAPGGVGPAAALQHAREAKAAVLQQLGLAVSVGAAPNRLLAKLASAAAKPDGVRLVADRAAALQLLAQTPARKLPGYGGKAAEAFERYGVRAATDLQRFSQPQMEQLFGLKPAAAAQLVQWCRGIDTTPVQERGPPKTLSVQMSLTPQLLPMQNYHGGPATVSAAGGRAGVLEPLVTGRPDFRLRVRQLMVAMGLDLLGRVQEDAAEEARWPKTLTASLRAFGAGKDQSFTSRSGGFPASGLAGQALRQDGRQQAAQPAAQQQAQPPQQAPPPRQAQAAAQQAQPRDALEEAVVHGLEQLVAAAAASYPPTAAVVELRLAATNFQSAAAAAAAAPITRFFAAAGSRGREPQPAEQQQQQEQPPDEQRQKQRQPVEQRQEQRQQQQPDERQQQQPQQQQQQQQQQGDVEPQLQQGDVEPQLQQRLQQPQQQAAAAAPPALRPPQRQASPESQQPEQRQGAGSPDVDLSSIDVREQQRILAELQQQQRRPPPKPSGAAAGSKRKAAAPAPDARQKSILAFLPSKK